MPLDRHGNRAGGLDVSFREYFREDWQAAPNLEAVEDAHRPTSSHDTISQANTTNRAGGQLLPDSNQLLRWRSNIGPRLKHIMHNHSKDHICEQYSLQHLQRLQQFEARMPWTGQKTVDMCKHLHAQPCGHCKTCHFCRQKTIDVKAACTRCRRVFWCGACLRERMGQNLDEILNTSQRNSWICPVCLDLCNCSGANCLRAQKGWEATHQLSHEATALRFKSVAHYLVMTQLHLEGEAASVPAALPAGDDGSVRQRPGVLHHGNAQGRRRLDRRAMEAQIQDDAAAQMRSMLARLGVQAQLQSAGPVFRAADVVLGQWRQVLEGAATNRTAASHSGLTGQPGPLDDDGEDDDDAYSTGPTAVNEAVPSGAVVMNEPAPTDGVGPQSQGPTQRRLRHRVAALTSTLQRVDSSHNIQGAQLTNLPATDLPNQQRARPVSIASGDTGVMLSAQGTVSDPHVEGDPAACEVMAAPSQFPTKRAFQAMQGEMATALHAGLPGQQNQAPRKLQRIAYVRQLESAMLRMPTTFAQHFAPHLWTAAVGPSHSYHQHQQGAIVTNDSRARALHAHPMQYPGHAVGYISGAAAAQCVAHQPRQQGAVADACTAVMDVQGQHGHAQLSTGGGDEQQVVGGMVRDSLQGSGTVGANGQRVQAEQLEAAGSESGIVQHGSGLRGVVTGTIPRGETDGPRSADAAVLPENGCIGDALDRQASVFQDQMQQSDVVGHSGYAAPAAHVSSGMADAVGDGTAAVRTADGDGDVAAGQGTWLSNANELGCEATPSHLSWPSPGDVAVAEVDPFLECDPCSGSSITHCTTHGLQELLDAVDRVPNCQTSVGKRILEGVFNQFCIQMPHRVVVTSSQGSTGTGAEPSEAVEEGIVNTERVSHDVYDWAVQLLVKLARKLPAEDGLQWNIQQILLAQDDTGSLDIAASDVQAHAIMMRGLTELFQVLLRDGAAGTAVALEVLKQLLDLIGQSQTQVVQVQERVECSPVHLMSTRSYDWGFLCLSAPAEVEDLPQFVAKTVAYVELCRALQLHALQWFLQQLQPDGGVDSRQTTSHTYSASAALQQQMAQLIVTHKCLSDLLQPSSKHVAPSVRQLAFLLLHATLDLLLHTTAPDTPPHQPIPARNHCIPASAQGAAPQQLRLPAHVLQSVMDDKLQCLEQLVQVDYPWRSETALVGIDDTMRNIARSEKVECLACAYALVWRSGERTCTQLLEASCKPYQPGPALWKGGAKAAACRKLSTFFMATVIEVVPDILCSPGLCSQLLHDWLRLLFEEHRACIRVAWQLLLAMTGARNVHSSDGIVQLLVSLPAELLVEQHFVRDASVRAKVAQTIVEQLQSRASCRDALHRMLSGLHAVVEARHRALQDAEAAIGAPSGQGNAASELLTPALLRYKLHATRLLNAVLAKLNRHLPKLHSAPQSLFPACKELLNCAATYVVQLFRHQSVLDRAGHQHGAYDSIAEVQLSELLTQGLQLVWLWGLPRLWMQKGVRVAAGADVGDAVDEPQLLLMVTKLMVMYAVAAFHMHSSGVSGCAPSAGRGRACSAAASALSSTDHGVPQVVQYALGSYVRYYCSQGAGLASTAATCLRSVIHMLEVVPAAARLQMLQLMLPAVASSLVLLLSPQKAACPVSHQLVYELLGTVLAHNTDLLPPELPDRLLDASDDGAINEASASAPPKLLLMGQAVSVALLTRILQILCRLALLALPCVVWQAQRMTSYTHPIMATTAKVLKQTCNTVLYQLSSKLVGKEQPLDALKAAITELAHQGLVPPNAAAGTTAASEAANSALTFAKNLIHRLNQCEAATSWACQSVGYYEDIIVPLLRIDPNALDEHTCLAFRQCLSATEVTLKASNSTVWRHHLEPYLRQGRLAVATDPATAAAVGHRAGAQARVVLGEGARQVIGAAGRTAEVTEVVGRTAGPAGGAAARIAGPAVAVVGRSAGPVNGAAGRTAVPAAQAAERIVGQAMVRAGRQAGPGVEATGKTLGIVSRPACAVASGRPLTAAVKQAQAALAKDSVQRVAVAGEARSAAGVSIRKEQNPQSVLPQQEGGEGGAAPSRNLAAGNVLPTAVPLRNLDAIKQERGEQRGVTSVHIAGAEGENGLHRSEVDAQTLNEIEKAARQRADQGVQGTFRERRALNAGNGAVAVMRQGIRALQDSGNLQANHGVVVKQQLPDNRAEPAANGRQKDGSEAGAAVQAAGDHVAGNGRAELLTSGVAVVPVPSKGVAGSKQQCAERSMQHGRPADATMQGQMWKSLDKIGQEDQGQAVHVVGWVDTDIKRVFGHKTKAKLQLRGPQGTRATVAFLSLHPDTKVVKKSMIIGLRGATVNFASGDQLVLVLPVIDGQSGLDLAPAGPAVNATARARDTIVLS